MDIKIYQSSKRKDVYVLLSKSILPETLPVGIQKSFGRFDFWKDSTVDPTKKGRIGISDKEISEDINKNGFCLIGEPLKPD